jgi:hypothetical protein
MGLDPPPGAAGNADPGDNKSATKGVEVVTQPAAYFAGSDHKCEIRTSQANLPPA